MSTKSTKMLILNAALTLFMQNGFAGTSISDIAKLAKINQSLIYHHFQSKEDLWTCTKRFCIESIMESMPPIRHDSLEHFVQDLLEVRFAVYKQESLRRLAHWQALEADPSVFYSQDDTAAQAFNIPQSIKGLQENGLVRHDQDYRVLAGFVFSLISYAFFDFAYAYALSEELREAYKQFLYDNLIHILNNK